MGMLLSIMDRLEQEVDSFLNRLSLLRERLKNTNAMNTEISSTFCNHKPIPLLQVIWETEFIRAS